MGGARWDGMERDVTVGELLWGVWRRRWSFLAILVVSVLVGLVALAFVPERYRSVAVLQLESVRPAAELVQSSVPLSMEARVSAAAEEILSREVLEGTVLALELFAEARAEGGMAAAVGLLRSMVEVRVPMGTQIVEIEVEGRDPERVAAIADELARRYVATAIAARVSQAEDILRVIEGELGRVTAEVEAVEGRIGELKRAHVGRLPEQLESNMRGLERLTGTQVARIESRRELARRLSDLEAGRGSGETRLGRLRRQSFELSAALSAAQSQWQADHPEVKRLRRELERVGQALRRAESETGERDMERAFLRGEMAAIDAEIRAIEREARFYRERIDGTPEVAQALSVLERDHELLRGKYQSLVSRRVEAEVARDLERVAGPRLFRLLTPATAPLQPHSPNRLNAVAIILAMSLALALFVSLARTLADDSLRGVEDARALDVPVLALVPRIDARRRA